MRVSGYGAGNAELRFDVEGGSTRTFTAMAAPIHEPQVFSAMASLVTTAYSKADRVKVVYFKHGELNIPTHVYLPRPPPLIGTVVPEPGELPVDLDTTVVQDFSFPKEE